MNIEQVFVDLQLTQEGNNIRCGGSVPQKFERGLLNIETSGASVYALFASRVVGHAAQKLSPIIVPCCSVMALY
jgi:hypothetical protein